MIEEFLLEFFRNFREFSLEFFRIFFRNFRELYIGEFV